MASTYQGVTVFCGISGFGCHGEIHSADLLRLDLHLPLVIEFFDAPEIINAAITVPANLVPAEHLLRWTVLFECGEPPST